MYVMHDIYVMHVTYVMYVMYVMHLCMYACMYPLRLSQPDQAARTMLGWRQTRVYTVCARGVCPAMAAAFPPHSLDSRLLPSVLSLRFRYYHLHQVFT